MSGQLELGEGIRDMYSGRYSATQLVSSSSSLAMTMILSPIAPGRGGGCSSVPCLMELCMYAGRLYWSQISLSFRTRRKIGISKMMEAQKRNRAGLLIVAYEHRALA